MVTKWTNSATNQCTKPIRVKTKTSFRNSEQNSILTFNMNATLKQVDELCNRVICITRRHGARSMQARVLSGNNEDSAIR